MIDGVEIILLAAVIGILLLRRTNAPKSYKSHGVIVDSCALIDGRIVEIT
ncbi:MAG: hypothetical protein JWL85_733, partial [Candidatus Saccharibacteria bacterium]|nr:hypothetical protein [Candidatus Saccharibacteria bacterium]